MNAHDTMKHFADEHGRTLKSLRVMAEANDPFFIGTPAHYKQAEWFLSYWQKFGDANTKVHLRRIHYRIVSLEPQERRKPDTQPRGRKRKSDIYDNTYNDWQYLITASKYARYLDLIDPELIIDQRSPEPGDHSKQYIPKETSWDLKEPKWDMPSIDTDLTWNLYWQMPKVSVEGYPYEESEGLQPYHVEIWIEKSTMDDVLIPLCKQYRVSLVTGVGFNSVTTVVRLIRERLAKDSRPCRILYISDFDPAGREMPRSMSRQVEFWLKKYGVDHDVRVNHLLLTQEQVEEYQLPRIPVKGSDRRKEKFEASHGEGQVELDALEALYPGEFERVVTEAILQFRDAELADAIQGAEEEANNIVTAAWEERIGPHRQELEDLQNEVQAIAEQYQEKLKKLAEGMEEELESLCEHRDNILHAIQTEGEEMEVELPELPKPEVEPDEDGWLYDSHRNYLEQLSYYKAHQNGADEDPSPTDEEDEAA